MTDDSHNEHALESIEDVPVSTITDSSASEMQSESHSRGRHKRQRRSSDMPTPSSNYPTRPTKAGKKHDDESNEATESIDADGHRKARPPHHRKRSDQTIDEGRRGRQGSHAYGTACRSDSPFEESEEQKQARHGRRRSSPPSRGPALKKENEVRVAETVEEDHSERDGDDENALGFRRRGSLPNHRKKYYDLRGVEVGEGARAYGEDGRRVGEVELGKQAPRRGSRHGRYDSAAIVSYEDDKTRNNERVGGQKIDGANEAIA